MTKLALVCLWENNEDNYDEYVEEPMLVLTMAQVAMYDGTNNMPMYIVFTGSIYDVTNSSAWSTVSH